YRLKGLIKKYSDYIRWPIKLGDETVNSMVPIWQRPKNEVTDEDCNTFFKDTFFATEDPASIIRVNAEGTVSYKALLFIPGKAPYGYYTKAYEPGLRLYSNGVMIMEKCADILPECFRFVRGVVDSPDLSLNISREMLQHDRQLKVIANNLEKKVKSELERMKLGEPEKYENFFKNFGLQLKYGAVDDYGMRKDELAPLLMFRTENTDCLTSLDDYIAAMPESQKYIYYACADTYAAAKALPQGEPVRDRGYDILCMTDHIDEFLVNILGKYGEKEFKSISDEDLGLETKEEKEELKKTGEENSELLSFVTEALGGKIVETRLSSKLIKHPVCLTAKGPVSIEMERNFIAAGAMESEHIKAERVLEINPAHPVFESLKAAYAEDKDKAANYAKLLYAQAELMSGIMPDDPAEFTDLVCNLMK
ncbi:MAG: molecular chaperone HtpG, partial [Oscillospiraceae bacterium]|nr:molecular chaperone HtpG [Oscillospiraceae bacterium]